MAWHDILGHEEILDRFRRSAAMGRLASTYLFVGPPGIGKRTFALQLAQSLLCERNSEAQLEACGKCSACQQVAAGTHPDLDFLNKPADKSFIPLELLIGDDEHRMREGLCHNISLKPFYGGRKIAILDDADYLNPEGANCLLKTLEEPPPRSIIILLGTSEQKQLPTIRSRCQIVRFQPLTREQVEQLLQKIGLVENENEARELSALSEGSLEQARQFSDPVVRRFRERLFDLLIANDLSLLDFAKELSTFVDAAGKEAGPRRQRLKHVASMAAEFYRQWMRGSTETLDSALSQSLARARAHLPANGEFAAACLERCLEVHNQVDANANQATLIESWLDDLSQIARR